MENLTGRRFQGLQKYLESGNLETPKIIRTRIRKSDKRVYTPAGTLQGFYRVLMCPLACSPGDVQQNFQISLDGHVNLLLG
jgi:hypothetical protein